MKALKNIWKIICYPLMYLAIQFVFAFVYTMFVTIVALMQLMIDSIVSGKEFEVSEAEIYDKLMSMIDINLITIISALISLFIVFMIMRKQWKAERFWTFKKVEFLPLLLCGFLGISSNLFINCIISLLPVEDLQNTMLERLFQSNIVLQFLCIAIVVPIIEEIVFRGIVQKRLNKMMIPFAAIIIQALIFGIAHLNPVQSTYTFFIGIIIGIVYLLFDSIWYPIIIHVTLNGTSVFLTAFLGDKEVNLLILIIVSFIIFAISTVCLIILGQKRKKDPIVVAPLIVPVTATALKPMIINPQNRWDY